MRRHPADPVFAQRLGVDVLRTQFIHGAQPGQLKVEIVVGERLALFGGKPCDVVHLAGAFIGRAQRSADVFTDPAGINSVVKRLFVKGNHKQPSCLLSLVISV